MFLTAFSELGHLYQRAKQDPAVAVRYNQWNRLLGVVLGEGPQDDDLFIRHTFLATIDKLVAYRVLEPDLPLDTDQQVIDVVTGKAFSDLSISNFIEEDFFTWFLAPPVKPEGVTFLRRLAGTLRRYENDQERPPRAGSRAA